MQLIVLPIMILGCESWLLRERKDQAAVSRNEPIKEDGRSDQASSTILGKRDYM